MDFEQSFLDRGALEGRRAREQGIQDAANAPQVRLDRVLLAQDFGGDVVWRPAHRLSLLLESVELQGQTKVDKLDGQTIVDQYVRQLQIPMDHVHRLHVMDRLCHLSKHVLGVLLGQPGSLAFLWDPLHKMVELLGLEMLEEEVHVGLIFEVVEKSDNLRTIELPVHLDLMVDPVLNVLRLQDLFIDHFERIGRFGPPTAHLVHD